MYKTVCYGSRIQLSYRGYAKTTGQEIKKEGLYFSDYGIRIDNSRGITNIRRNIDNNGYIVSQKAVVMAGNLRYYALGAYTGLIALWTSMGTIELDETTSIALLAPIAILIGADYLKHKADSK